MHATTIIIIIDDTIMVNTLTQVMVALIYKTQNPYSLSTPDISYQHFEPYHVVPELEVWHCGGKDRYQRSLWRRDKRLVRNSCVSC